MGIYRIVSRGPTGGIRHRDFSSIEEILSRYHQVSHEDCSVHLELHGLPVFQGLIGPMLDGEGVIRYETPEVFEKLTKLWSAPKRKRRSRVAGG